MSKMSFKFPRANELTSYYHYAVNYMLTIQPRRKQWSYINCEKCLNDFLQKILYSFKTPINQSLNIVKEILCIFNFFDK